MRFPQPKKAKPSGKRALKTTPSGGGGKQSHKKWEHVAIREARAGHSPRTIAKRLSVNLKDVQAVLERTRT